MDAERLALNIRRIRENLDKAAQAWNRMPTLCAVTKTIDATEINALHALGVLDIGENRVQEIREKLPSLKTGFRLHMIGQLQTNKVKYIISGVETVQSLDRLSLAEELSRRAVEAKRVIPALVQVNIANEPQKAGIRIEELPDFLKQCAQLNGIHVSGLMAIMPVSPDPEQLRPLFRGMREAFDRLRHDAPDGVEILSMGMSNDYIVAAEEGATMVRIGSGIFGERKDK